MTVSDERESSRSFAPLSKLARGFRRRTLPTARVMARLGWQMAKKNLSAREMADRIDEEQATRAAEELLEELGGLKGFAMNRRRRKGSGPRAPRPHARGVRLPPGGENQEQLRAALADLEDVSIPRTFPELSSRRVLTTELIDRGGFYDFRDDAAPEARNRAGQAIYAAAFTSIFRHRAFNADPHPGNYLFDPAGRWDELFRAALGRAAPGCGPGGGAETTDAGAARGAGRRRWGAGGGLSASRAGPCRRRPSGSRCASR